MSTPLSNFLIEVSQNAALLHKLREEPKAVAEAAGLTAEELEALLSEDPLRIYSILENGLELCPLMLNPQYVFSN